MIKTDDATAKRRKAWLYLLLLVPFVVLCAVPYFNRVEPRLFGLPFFWWFQLMWIPLSAGLTAIVYFATEGNSRDEEIR